MFLVHPLEPLMTQPRPTIPTLDKDRRTWLLASGAMGCAGAAAVAIPFVSSFTPSERAKAQGASVEVDFSGLQPAEMLTVEWRGKPVWIMRRTPEMLADLENMKDLADPQSKVEQQPAYAQNTPRSIKPEIFVTVGICTHLGCSPVTLNAQTHNPSVPADWKGGFFCPCHGSTFDYAGRVFKNKPAPTNLEIPPHVFLSETTLLIGEDQAA
jgi:ubiquinol-cytochrome c reductase iron-sulfur subunit